ncbi:MAG: phosphatase PAP2 family protein [Candidatus Dormiibacterota bacterium]
MARASTVATGSRREGTSARLHRLTGDVNPILMSVAVVSGFLFVVLSVLVAMHPAPFFFDRPIEVAVQSVAVGPFEWFNAFVSAFSGFVGLGVGAAVIALTFLLRRPATPLVAFSAIYSAVYNVVNIIVQRPRPEGVAHTTSKLIGFSYPSGHVGFFVWLSVLAMVLLARGLPRPMYVACWFFAVVLVVASALSRIYVGAHWPSDVLGGLLIGVAWTALSLSLGRLTRPVFAEAQTSRK